MSGHKAGGGHKAPPPAITSEGGKMKESMSRGVILLAIFLMVVFGYRSCQDKQETKKVDEAEEQAATLAAQPPAPAHVVEQFPDCYTPCEIRIEKIRDLYTDGDPIYALPPGWHEDRKILYSGKGHLVVQGGNIRSGLWKFRSADEKEPDKAVLIRVFGR